MVRSVCVGFRIVEVFGEGKGRVCMVFACGTR